MALINCKEWEKKLCLLLKKFVTHTLIRLVIDTIIPTKNGTYLSLKSIVILNLIKHKIIKVVINMPIIIFDLLNFIFLSNYYSTRKLYPILMQI